MENSQKFMIAKKIKRNVKLTKEEQKFVNDYVKNYLLECEII